MYLLLALGIALGGLFVGGALLGFAVGFVDGYSTAGGAAAPVDSRSLLIGGIVIIVLLLCALLQWVFLHMGFASYSAGRIPRAQRWQVVAALLLTMGGLALLAVILYNPLAAPGGNPSDALDTSMYSYYALAKSQPLVSLPVMAVVEATGNLIVYGGVLRELLDWKHRPQIILAVYAALMGLITGLTSDWLLAIPSVMMALVEAYTYECSRSIIPVTIADVFYWTVMLLLLGTPLPAWVLVPAAGLIIVGALYLTRTMDPYKPID